MNKRLPVFLLFFAFASIVRAQEVTAGVVGTVMDSSGAGVPAAAVAVATDGRLILPDGSVNQNDWCATHDLKRSTFAACRLQDGLTRIGFIRPSVLHRIGHVYLAHNGRTLESWGGHGPGSRPIITHILSAETTDVYVLAVRP